MVFHCFDDYGGDGGRYYDSIDLLDTYHSKAIVAPSLNNEPLGMGYSWPYGIVICCDGTEAADKRIARVLWNDPATGVMRHADAGYDIAKQCAVEQGLKLPMG